MLCSHSQRPSYACLRKHRSLFIALGLLASTILGLRWVMSVWAVDPRASLIIVSDGAFSAPTLALNGRVPPHRVAGRGPWYMYAWANLRMPEGDTRLSLSWTGADGEQRNLQVVVFQGRDSVAAHCAYLLRLDAKGDPIAPAESLHSGPLATFCHF
jgi:hypothetical protein